jgi:hypothetical protein
MRSDRIFARILLVFSVANVALAAPAAVRQRHLEVAKAALKRRGSNSGDGETSDLPPEPSSPMPSIFLRTSQIGTGCCGLTRPSRLPRRRIVLRRKRPGRRVRASGQRLICRLSRRRVYHRTILLRTSGRGCITGRRLIRHMRRGRRVQATGQRAIWRRSRRCVCLLCHRRKVLLRTWIARCRLSHLPRRRIVL